MSAASVVSPLTTNYIQAPTRFMAPGDAAQSRAQWAATAAHTSSPYAVRSFAGTQPRVVDDQPNPVNFRPTNGNPFAQTDSYRPLSATTRARTPPEQQQQQYYQQQSSPLSPSKAPRVNPNSRCSAAFPLAVTAQQKAAAAERQLEQRLAWEAMHEAAAAEAEENAAEAAAAAKRAQADMHKRQMRDCKIPFRERILPPKPDHPEDPLTAHAAEHTGRYPGPLIRSARPPTPIDRDTEPAAAEGSAERFAQKRRTNPLLDPLYQCKNDAAGLGYGRTHRNHFRYISHWTTPDSAYSSADIASSAASLNGYRSKDGRGYQPEVRSLGWGAPHSRYNAYVSVRRAEDVLKDYPNREACLKFYNRA